MDKLTLIIGFIFIIVLGQFLISNMKLLSQPVGGDFKYFYNTGQRVLSGLNPYILEDGVLLRNPPPTLFIYSLFPFFPIKLSQTLFWIISFSAFLIGSFFLFKVINYSPSLKILLGYLIAIILFFPFRYTLGSGHINNLLFIFLVLTFYFIKSNKWLLSGMFLALSIVLSVTPTFLLFVLLLQKRYLSILWTIVTLIFLFLITYIRFGAEVFISYQKISSSYFDFGVSSYYNQSLTAFLTRVFQNPEISKIIVFTVLSLALLMLLFFLLYFKNNSSQNLMIWSISMIYILIFAPFAWQYHFVITIFPLFTTLYLVLKTKQNFAFIFLIGVSYILISLNIKNPQIFDGIKIRPVILSHVFIGSLLLLALNFYLLRKLKNNY